jgi:hypothetical protein
VFLLDAAIQGEWGAFWDIFRHIILPASLLGYFSMAYISRMTRSFMLNELSQEYIVAARAKGLSEQRIIWGHALRNAAVPLVTVIALSYATLEGSVLTETIRLAGHRHVPHQLAAECRHERGAWCDDRHRRRVHCAQPFGRSALPAARPRTR